MHDSIIIKTTPYLKKSLDRNDTSSILYSGLSIAQAYLFKEQTDSARLYMDIIQKYMNGCKDPKIKVTDYNMLGILAIKEELNYSKALDFYQKAYFILSKGDDLNNKIVLLTNIVNIFYLREDPSGIRYAKQAYTLASEYTDKTNPFIRCMGYISYVQMLMLSGEISRASEILEEAYETTEKYGFKSPYPMIYLLKAELQTRKGNTEEAVKYYNSALEMSIYAEPGIKSLICLKYGDFLTGTKNRKQAETIYMKGLDNSYTFHNMEFRRNLLERLFALYYVSGKKEEALEYFWDYMKHLDSLSINKRENEFNNLLIKYEDAENERIIKTKEIEVLKANRRSIIISMLLIIIGLVFALFISLYRKQRQMYKALSGQYKIFMERYESLQNYRIATEEKTDTSDTMPADKSLFFKIESLMRDDRLYTKKNISLEDLAEILESNRTYISKTINAYSGMTFPSYINMYRIKEAVKMMEATECEYTIKQIADTVGYNSVTVFHRAFQKETGCTPSKYQKDRNRHMPS